MRLGGRYELLGELGSGGMARVWRARDTTLGRDVAVKVLHPRFGPSTAPRLIREARALAAVDHPHVVRVFDAGESPQGPYLVMEFLVGRTIEARMRDGPWPLREAVESLEAVARAVHAAHEAGIVHRDLKPSNIMREPDGRIVVTDFSLAHAIKAEDALTKAGAVIGTPLYMAPEQVRGRNEAIDARTDVYALGVMLYEAATGRLPHVGRTLVEVYESILVADAVPPRALSRDVPVELEAICLRAIAREPERRFQTALAFAEALRGFLAGTRANTVVRRRASPSRRRRWAAVAIAGVVAAVAVAAGVVARPRGAEVDAQRRGRERLARGEYVAAVADLTAAIDRDPRCWSAYADRAAALDGLGALDAALKDHDAAVAGDPTRAIAHLHRASTLLRLGRATEARDSLDEALRLDGTLADGLLMRAQVRALLDDLDGAFRDFEDALRRAPGDASVWHNRAVLRLKCGDAIGALRDLDEAVAIRPHYAETRSVRATTRSWLGDSEGARRDYDEAIRLRPGHAATFSNRGSLRLSTGDPAGALDDFERAVDLAPEDVMFRCNRALALEQLGRIAAALDELTEAVRRSPNASRPYAFRAIVRASSGDLPGGLEDCARAVELGRREPDPYYARAKVRALLGDVDAQIADLQVALTFAPRLWPWREVVEAELRRLKVR
jgi:tetratricopeptide (TPR) repeat protein